MHENNVVHCHPPILPKCKLMGALENEILVLVKIRSVTLWGSQRIQF